MNEINLNQPLFDQLVDLEEKEVKRVLILFFNSQLLNGLNSKAQEVGLWMRRADQHFLEKTVSDWFKNLPSKECLEIIRNFLTGYWTDELLSEKEQQELKQSLLLWEKQFK